MLKITLLHDAVIDERQHKAVGKAWAQLLHEIKRQRCAARAVAVEKADIGVQPDRFERGGAVIGKQAVGKRQHGVYVIERRTAVSFAEEKVRLVLQDHLIKDIKIRLCANALTAAQRLHGNFVGDKRIECLDLVNGCLQPRGIDTQRMVALRALNAPAGVIELAEDHIARNAAALRRIVRRAVLHPAQQDVSVLLADASGKEPADRRAEGQADAALRAAAHERRRRACIAERNDPRKRMQGKARDLLLFPVHDDIFPVERQICVLTGDKERIEKLSHGVSSMLL